MGEAETGVICAYDFPEDAAPKPLGDGALTGSAAAGWRWVHVNVESPARQWLLRGAGLPALASEALLDEDTRPHIAVIEEGTLVTLRGVNLNEGAEPEDMISLHLWIAPDRVISARRQKIFAIDAIRRRADSGRSFASIGAFLAALVEGLTDRIATVVDGMEDRIDGYEEASLEDRNPGLRKRLVELRRDIIALRRFLVPQRDVLAKLAALECDWLDDRSRARIAEVGEDLSRIVDMLAAVRERAILVQENIMSEATERMNRTMYMLSMVATIFLPLGFFTGLLGINVGGIPGTDSPWAFEIVCALLAAICVLQILLFRRMRMF